MAKTCAFIKCLQAKSEHQVTFRELFGYIGQGCCSLTVHGDRRGSSGGWGGRGGTKRCWRASLCVSEYDVLAITSTSYLTFIVVSCTYERLGRCCGSRTTRSTSPTLTPLVDRVRGRRRLANRKAFYGANTTAVYSS